MKITIKPRPQEPYSGDKKVLLDRIAELEKALEAKPATPADINQQLNDIIKDSARDDGAPVNYEPTIIFLNSVWGNITTHGIKIMADGRQWVVSALSGLVFERKDAKPMQDKKGNIFWIGKDEKLSPIDVLNFHRWKNPGQLSI